MKTTPEISVIVPIYNVEKYLNQCIESIIIQDFVDFELILVDDGSPDNCPQICDEWAKKDNRIKVIHKINGGLPDARNSGIKAATGKYIAFVDGDDWIEKDFLNILHTEIENNNADIVQCNYRIAGENISNDCVFRPEVFDRGKIVSVLFEQFKYANLDNLIPSRCIKIYKYDIAVRAIEYCDVSISMAEDYLFTFASICMSNKIVVADTKAIYNYRINNQSISNLYNLNLKYNSLKFFDNVASIADAFCIAYDKNIHKYLINKDYVYFIYKCVSSNLTVDKKISEINTLLEMIDKNICFKAIKLEKSISKRYIMYLYMSVMYLFGVNAAIKVINCINKIRRG